MGSLLLARDPAPKSHFRVCFLGARQSLDYSLETKKEHCVLEVCWGNALGRHVQGSEVDTVVQREKLPNNAIAT